MTMDIAISAHREGGHALVWLACCHNGKAWVVGASPGERPKLMRKLRGALIGEYTTSGEAFRAAWDKLMPRTPAQEQPASTTFLWTRRTLLKTRPHDSLNAQARGVLSGERDRRDPPRTDADGLCVRRVI
jgi:hypothetical protein